MKRIAILSIPLLMIACGEEKASENTNEQNDQKKDSTIVEDTIVETVLTDNWYNYFMVTNADFEVDGDTLNYSNETTPYFLPNNENGNNNTIIYSPDSTYGIDLDSYGVEIGKDSLGNKTFYGTEVDSKVYLINLTNAKVSAMELMMCGTYCNPLDAVWESNTVVKILGTSYNDELDTSFPTVWKYDIENEVFLQYTSTTPVKEGVGNYFEEVRLPLLLK